MYVQCMTHTFHHQVLCDMPKKCRCNIFFANVSGIALNFTVHRIEYNSTNKIYVNSLPARNEFKAALFRLCLKKLPWKSFGILVAYVNGKKCPQPRASGVCDFKELSK